MDMRALDPNSYLRVPSSRVTSKSLSRFSGSIEDAPLTGAEKARVRSIVKESRELLRKRRIRIAAARAMYESILHDSTLFMSPERLTRREAAAVSYEQIISSLERVIALKTALARQDWLKLAEDCLSAWRAVEMTPITNRDKSQRPRPRRTAPPLDPASIWIFADSIGYRPRNGTVRFQDFVERAAAHFGYSTTLIRATYTEAIRAFANEPSAMRLMAIARGSK